MPCPFGFNGGGARSEKIRPRRKFKFIAMPRIVWPSFWHFPICRKFDEFGFPTASDELKYAARVITPAEFKWSGEESDLEKNVFNRVGCSDTQSIRS